MRRSAIHSPEVKFIQASLEIHAALRAAIHRKKRACPFLQNLDHFFDGFAVGDDLAVVVEGFAEGADAVVFLFQSAREHKVAVVGELGEAALVKLLFADGEQVGVMRQAEPRLQRERLAEIVVRLIHPRELHQQVAEVEIHAVADVAAGVERPRLLRLLFPPSRPQR